VAIVVEPHIEQQKAKVSAPPNPADEEKKKKKKKKKKVTGPLMKKSVRYPTKFSFLE